MAHKVFEVELAFPRGAQLVSYRTAMTPVICATSRRSGGGVRDVVGGGLSSGSCADVCCEIPGQVPGYVSGVAGVVAGLTSCDEDAWFGAPSRRF